MADFVGMEATPETVVAISDATRYAGKTCEKIVRKGIRHRLCGKPASAELGGSFFCKAHDLKKRKDKGAWVIRNEY